MTSKQITTDYTIYPEADGRWGVYHINSDRARSFHSTEDDAADAARKVQAYADTQTAQYAAAKAAADAHRVEVEQAAAREADMVTDRQVDYIMSLLRQGRASEGGFYTGPTTREGVQRMTRGSASAYITSLTGRY